MTSHNTASALEIMAMASLLVNMKSFAGERKINISELVERYFKSIQKPDKNVNIIEMVDNFKELEFDVFLDANVLLDHMLKRDNYKDAREILIW